MDLPRKLSYVRLDDITPAAANPRVHDLLSIKASMREFGYMEPLLLDERTGRLVGGHGRVEALVELRTEGDVTPRGIVIDEDGMWLVPMLRGWASADDTAAAAALVALNKLTENARWNDYGLAEMLEQIATDAPGLLDATGFDHEDLDELLRTVNPERLNTDPEPMPDLDDDDPTETTDDGEGTVSLEEYRDDNPTICCPACGHTFARKV